MQTESKFAIFDYHEIDKNLINELATYLDDNVQKIFDFFEIEAPSNKILIHIIPTKKEYDEIYKSVWNRDPENWSIGFYCGKTKEITCLSVNDYKNTSHAFKKQNFHFMMNYYKKTIVHEFTHYVNHLFIKLNNYSHTEKYLSEGLATYLSGQEDESKININCSIDQILNNRNCYDDWCLITKYLIENYDKRFVFSLIKSSHKARKFFQDELYYRAINHYKTQLSETPTTAQIEMTIKI